MSRNLRKQFEAFAMEKLVVSRGDLLLRDSGNRYRCADIEQAWEIFQAGHAVNADVLEALEQCLEHIELNETSESASVVAQIARDAIKKERVENE